LKSDTLLTKLRKGNEKAFDQVFENYSDAIYNFLRKNCLSSEDAEDLLQEIFLKLWLYRENIQPDSSLSSYLFTIARNTLLNYIRDRAKKRLFEFLINEAELKDSFKENEDNDMSCIIREIDEIAQGMPPKRKEVYELRWIEGLSRKEIAEKMEISIVTVDIHLRKAIDYLKSVVKKTGFYFLFFCIFYILLY